MAASILIVEDETLVALDMEGTLEAQGHRVVGIAADLEEALAYKDEPLDLALIDLNLRDGFTGPQIGEWFAKKQKADVLFVTANPRLLGEGVSGAIGVLSKPTDQEALTSAVDFALSRRQGQPASAPPSLRCFG
jgi:DNA-binding response OmpR family regulator